MESDAFIFGNGYGTSCEADTSHHKALVRGDILADLLQEHYVTLINLFRCPPLCVSYVQIKGQLATGFPLEVDLVHVHREPRSLRVGDLG